MATAVEQREPECYSVEWWAAKMREHGAPYQVGFAARALQFARDDIRGALDALDRGEPDAVGKFLQHRLRILNDDLAIFALVDPSLKFADPGELP